MVENHLATAFAEQRTEIEAALSALQSADLSNLPKKLRGRIEDATKSASGLYTNLDVAGAKDDLQLAKEDYAPSHTSS